MTYKHYIWSDIKYTHGITTHSCFSFQIFLQNKSDCEGHEHKPNMMVNMTEVHINCEKKIRSGLNAIYKLFQSYLLYAPSY